MHDFFAYSIFDLLFRQGEPICASYFSTGNCSAGPICRFDHPRLVSIRLNISSMASQKPPIHMLGHSLTLGGPFPYTKKPRIHYNTSSMSSEALQYHQLEQSSSLGLSSSGLVEASVGSVITEASVGRDTLIQSREKIYDW